MNRNLIQKILSQFQSLEQKKVFAGFDGFIDTIVKPVLTSGGDSGNMDYFKTIDEFGRFISAHAHKSSSIELDVMDRRIGGNMPNFTKALGTLGLDISSIGMLDNENGGIDPIFKTLPGKLYSYAPAGTATAMEFNDGKILLAPGYSLKDDPVKLIKKALAPKTIPELVREFDLMVFLNWSELPYSSSVWQAFFDEVCAAGKVNKDGFVFFDLCDFNRRTRDELSGVIKLMKQFTQYRTTILSLNKNEASLLYERTRGEIPQAIDMDDLLKYLQDSFQIDEIIIHQHHESLLICSEGLVKSPVMRIENPKISTGAGDNFNAAYCFARLLDLTPLERLRFANLYAQNYIAIGKSLKLESLSF